MDYKEEIRKILKEDTTIPPEQREKLEEVLINAEKIEDERIRKDIVSFLHSKNGYMTPNEDWDFHNRWLLWLEKQANKPQGKSALEAAKEEKVNNANKFVSGQSEQGSHWCRINNVYPIPLTTEILERNGFELKPDGWIWCKDDGNEEQNYIFIQFRKGCDEVRTVELNFVGKVQGTFRQVQDVHELQNLLNICRIKKEIEL